MFISNRCSRWMRIRYIRVESGLNIKRDQNTRSKRIFKVSRALEEWQKMITIELVHNVNNSVVPDLRNQLTIAFLELFLHVNPVLETLWPLGTANMDGVTVTVELVMDLVWCKLTEDIIQKLEHGIHKLILNKAWILKNETWKAVTRICSNADKIVISNQKQLIYWSIQSTVLPEIIPVGNSSKKLKEVKL